MCGLCCSAAIMLHHIAAGVGRIAAFTIESSDYVGMLCHGRGCDSGSVAATGSHLAADVVGSVVDAHDAVRTKR